MPIDKAKEMPRFIPGGLKLCNYLFYIALQNDGRGYSSAVTPPMVPYGDNRNVSNPALLSVPATFGSTDRQKSGGPLLLF